MESHVLLYCRAGFEPECAAEIVARCARLGLIAKPTLTLDSAYVPAAITLPAAEQNALKQIQFQDLVFARQLLFEARLIQDLPSQDRVRPLVSKIREAGLVFSALSLETADTNAAKELSAFCRKFTPPLEHALNELGLLAGNEYAPRLHLFWLDSHRVYLAYSYPSNSSAWPMGIPRVKLGRGAPSRSALKLAEAWMVFLSEEQEEEWLHAGVSAVDLGAAPGGWTWQLAQREVHVTAVDNGALHADLRGNGLVEHVRADGFRYWPKRAVDWLVCDMVESPKRITELIARWLAEGKCRHTIFNLKLPMKKRWETYQQCRSVLETALADRAYRMQFKQLYHDRMEMTGFISLDVPSKRKRRY